MDALSKIFDDIHLNKAEYVYLKASGEWCFYMDAQAAVVAHIVLAGTLHLQYAEHSLIAHAGDIVLIPSGIAHIANASEHCKLVEPIDLAMLFQGHRNEPIELGDLATQVVNKNNAVKHDAILPVDDFLHHNQDNASKNSVSNAEKNDSLSANHTTVNSTSNHVDHSSLFSLSFRSHIDTSMARPLLNALPKVMHIQSLMTSRAPEWLQIGLMFVGMETQQMLPGRDKILDHLVSILFIECVRDYICGLSDQNNWLTALTHPELSSALAAIHGQPQFGWTVESLAEQCCMSRSKFANLFHSVVGESPLAYLQQHRLRLASQMLRESNFNIQQIANRVGYSSENAFSQAFKRQHEISPKQYRQAHLASLDF